MPFPHEEKSAWAREKAPEVISELRENYAELWEKYTTEERDVGAVTSEISEKMTQIVNRLFPGSTLIDVSYIIIETRSLARRMLNLPASPSDDQ